MHIEVVYCPSPDEVDRVELQLAGGATVRQALRCSGVLKRHPGLDPAHARCGIHGRRVGPDAALRDGDRVELYRPLQIDPMQARRLRAGRQRDASGRRRSPKR